MDSLSNFEKETEHIEDDVRSLEKELQINSEEVDESISKDMPNHYIKMTPKKNLERLAKLKEKMEDGSITDGELEEYGWRIINQ